MFEALRRWRQKRVLASSAIPEPLWREALESLPFLAIYTDAELARLRQRVVLFLSEVFFAEPTLLQTEYPKVYQLFTWFYRQDPASRAELLLEG